MQVTARISPFSRKPRIRHIAQQLFISCLICAVAVQGALADPVTYKQLRQDPSSRTLTTASIPNVARTDDRKDQPLGSQSGQGPQAPTVQESPSHPEFIRLPDGRIVRYGPGILCDENCVEPVAPAAYRGPGPALWWIVPPIVAGGILCAILCRPGNDREPQPTPTIIIPQPSVTPIPIVSPTVAPSVGPTVGPSVTPTVMVSPTILPSPTPPGQVPEPGTIVLFGLGLSTLIARRRKKGKKDDQE